MAGRACHTPQSALQKQRKRGHRRPQHVCLECPMHCCAHKSYDSRPLPWRDILHSLQGNITV